jgi:hypothetical protein
VERILTSATIKLFLPRGDAKSLRTAEISNWTGKAIAAPRTELDELLAREELDKAGVYILIGNDPQTNAPRAYIGEAEVIRERLKQHKTKEFWVSAIVAFHDDELLSSDARSHPARLAPASYALCANSRISSRGDFARRTSSYISRNSCSLSW